MNLIDGSLASRHFSAELVGVFAVVALLLASVRWTHRHWSRDRSHTVGNHGPLISTVLYGVRPLDPEVFLAVPLIPMVVAPLAIYIPRPAANVNPIVALRES